MKNFLSYKELHLTFTPGIVRLTGQSSSGSNGSGKSAILSSLPWIVWGRVLKDMKDQERIIRRGADRCEGEMTGTIDDQPFSLSRIVTPNKHRIVTDLCASSRKPEIQAQLDRTFRSFGLGCSTFILASRMANEFINSNDARRKSILDEMFQYDRYRQGREELLKDLKQIRLTLKHHDSMATERSHELERQITEIGHQIELSRRSTDVERRQLILRLEEQQDIVRKEEKPLNRLRLQYSAGEDKMDALYDEVAAIKSSLQDHDKELERLTDEMERLKLQLIHNRCGTCGQAIKVDRAGIDRRIEQIKLKVEKIVKALEEYRREMKEQIEYRDRLQAYTDRKDRTIRTHEQNIFRARHVMVRLKHQIKDLEYQETDWRSSVPLLIRLRQERDHHRRIATMIQTYIPYMEYWDEGLGPYGIPASLIESSLPMLNDRTNQILHQMTEGRFRLIISPTSEGKRIVTDKLSFIVYDHQIKTTLGEIGDGQKSRIVISLFLAMSSLQQTLSSLSWNVKLIDELFDCLDEPGIDAVMRVLRETMNEDECIVIASHIDSLNLNRPFDHHWMVRHDVDRKISRLKVIDG